jgi:predicted  nucleic acid-binding Zn-ribbon protein
MSCNTDALNDINAFRDIIEQKRIKISLDDINTLRDIIEQKRVKIDKLYNEINGLRCTIEFQTMELKEYERAFKNQLETKDENINP